MGKIRDFIYNSSDIFLAVIILAAACFLIWTRIQVIMAYPESYEPSEGLQQEEPGQALSTESAITSEGALSTTDPAITSGAAAQSGEEAAVTPPPAPTSITVEIPEGATAEEVADILHQSGIIAEPEDFLYAATQMERYGSMKSGSFTLHSGASAEELVEILTN